MNININNLVYQLIPPHKRLPLRTRWLRTLTRPLDSLWTEFDRWRSETRMMVNVNCQKLVLEGYLRKKYKRQDVSIKIEDYDDQLLAVSKNQEESEETMPEFMLRETDPETPAIPMQGEIRLRFKNVDFVVHIPEDLDEELIAAEVEKYKQAQIKYMIIKSN